MTLRNMEVFLAVVEHLNMSKAAAALHIAQPTISQTIKEIEQEYSCSLFDRLGKKLYLTPEGACLAEHTRAILLQVRNMNDSIANIAKHPKLSVGATITIGQSLLAPALQQFEETVPEAYVQVIVENTAEIEKLLLAGQLDIAFVEGTVQSKDLTTTQLCQDQMVLVCHASHPLARKKKLFLRDVLAYPFLVREQGSGTRDLFQKELDSRGLEINIKWTAHSFDSIISAIQVKQGISVFSRLITQKYNANKEIVAISFADITLMRDFCLVHHKNRQVSSTAQQLIQSFITTSQHIR